MREGITIRPYGQGWQASVFVRRPEFAKLPGVLGTQSDSGPWIGGEGTTPDQALEALHLSIGRVMLQVLLSEGNEP
jgi:hypothetical protein